MATVRQLIEKIQHHEKLNDDQKKYVIRLILHAEADIALEQSLKPKRRTIRNRGGDMILEDWESQKGRLTIETVSKWVFSKKLCPIQVRELVEEFRIEMMSRGKMYADFKAAFINYMNKGYLSKKLHQVRAADSPHSSSYKHQEISRGGSI